MSPPPAAIPPERFEPPGPEEAARAREHLMQAAREARRSRRIPEGAEAREVEAAGIVGFGVMGRGIALSFAAAGMPVSVFEESDAAWARGLEAVAGTLSRAVARGRLTEGEAETRKQRIRRAARLEDLAGADFFVEAAFEDLEVKRRVFRGLDRTAPPGAVLATNTSSLDVNAIAAATGRPEAVLGTHFFSPAQVMRLLEVVVADRTSGDTLATTMRLAERLGKIPVPVGVCDGFVGNRMLYAYRREADRLLLEGALPEEADRALRNFGFAMGPFEVADLAGLDIGAAVRKRQAREAEARGEPPPPASVADRLVERNRLGQKTGAGFYRYEPGDRTPRPDPEVAAVVRAASAAAGVERRPVPPAEIRERCLAALVAEGRAVLQDAVAERSGDVDLVWTLGYGFPAERGGPMYWAGERDPEAAPGAGAR